MKDSLPDLDAALKAEGLVVWWDDCTPSHRRETQQWISEAKKPETRAKRIAQAVIRIAERKRWEEAKRKK